MENPDIKLAFQKVKNDISFLNSEISSIKSEITEIKQLIRSLHEDLAMQKLKQLADSPSINSFSEPVQQTNSQTNQQTDTKTDRFTNNPTHFQSLSRENEAFQAYNPSIRQINQSIAAIPTQNPTVPQEIEGLKDPILNTSIGNGGVQTDKQTYQQTNRQTEKPLDLNIQEASTILNSLDRLKKEIRLKFKRITNQEMAVFSTIYQLEETDPDETTYKKIADLLKLSESSIRDYVQKLISKGISIKKQKINNKKILLSVSPELKKIASLNTIVKLREL